MAAKLAGKPEFRKIARNGRWPRTKLTQLNDEAVRLSGIAVSEELQRLNRR